MADDVIIRYKAVPEGFDKVGVAVQTVTNETKELQTQIKATFADKTIEDATRRLYEQGDVMGALINKYGNATSALKAMEKELATMSALGQRGTKEFKELANATAQLKNNLGDTRNEIQKLSSSTAVFDTMVQGARGVAAAFSVATGLAASLGDENKDLQKTLLKVQGAMAALQGVQELANIATEKGGIATKAYGVALQVVDKISKVTGLSMAASWAMATAGITLVIAGVVALIAYLHQANDVQEAIKKADEKRKAEIEKTDEINKIIRENTSKANKIELEQAKLKAKTTEEAAKAEIKYNKDIADSLSSKVRALRGFVGSFKESEKGSKAFRDAEALLLDTELAQVAVLRDIQSLEKGIAGDRKRAKQEATENITPFSLPDAPDKDKVENFLKGVQEAINISKVPEIPVKLTVPKREIEDIVQEIATTITSQLQQLSPVVNAYGEFMGAIYSRETAELNEEKERQLKIAGDNAKKREQIERNFAIKKAKIEREQAITNKIIGAFQAVTNTAVAITKALPNYALVALAAATGALQIATIAAQPLPQVPKFEKGGAVALAGGRIADGHLFGKSHREGGILINAQGGEYVWDIPTVKKHGDLIRAAHENRIEDLVMHKYVVPMMKGSSVSKTQEAYDDWRLRSTIKQGQHAERENSRFIVSGIVNGLSQQNYLTNRYLQ